jgi:ribonuclease P protein component
MEKPIPRLTFRKEEKLCSKIAIEKLFGSGKSFYLSPIKVLVLKTPSPVTAPVKVLITVPKKYIRHAVDRNRIKRLIRESYRMNKQILQTMNLSGYELSIAFIYTSKQLAEFNVINHLMDRILHQVVQLENSNKALD